MLNARWWIACILGVVSMAGNRAQSAEQKPGLLFAHRGGSFEFEENTMEAFRGSYEQGLRGFETDVRMTKDGKFVILHDDSLDRTHNASGPVEHKTAAELRAATTKKSGQPMLFLDELLAYFADKPGVYLELEMKTRNQDLYPDARINEYCKQLLAAVQARQPPGSTYVFTSFDERPLKEMISLDANVDGLLITDGPCSAAIVERARKLGVNRIGVRMDGTSRAAVRAAQQAGLRVSGWPGHTLQDYQLAVGLGLDAICSDIPVAVHAWKTAHQ